MVRSLVVALLLIAVLAAQQNPAFDAVSIKRNTTVVDRTRPPLRGSPGRFVRTDTTALELLGYAYDLRRQEIINAPGWASAARYDVQATYSPAGTTDDLPAMMRQVLADRFHLVVHTERRETQVFALVRARRDGRLGPRLRAWTVDCAALRAGTASAPTTFSSLEAGITVPPCSMVLTSGLFAVGGMPLATLADSLGWELGRRVIDRTGLQGPFEFLLEWAPDALADRSRPSLSVALQEQLGLELDSERAEVDVLVIDRIERPSEN
jgi:uncharacterized protein (TIGR03435 family)